MGAMSNLLLADSFVSGLLNVLSLIMMIADAALVAYAVYMFFMMATAHDEGKRRNVKKHFFNTLSAILIILALIGTLSVIKVNITTVQQETGGGGGSVSAPGKTLTISQSFNNGQWLYQGSFNIKTTDVKVSGGTAMTITNFKPTGSGDFAASYWTAVTAQSGGMTVRYTQTSSSNKKLQASSRTIQYTVTVSIKLSDGTQSTKTASGSITLSGSCLA